MEDELFVHATRTANQPGIRVDVFLFRELSEFTSRSRLLKAFREGFVTVNGRPIKASYRLKVGDIVEAVLPIPVETHPPQPQPVSFATLYEDSHIVVVNKRAGLVVHPGAGTPNGTLLNGLLYRYGKALLVHRLDKDTSGVMVVALNQEAQFRLCQQFAQRIVEKKYLAIVWGVPPDSQFEVNLPIGRHPTRRVCFTVVMHGREAMSKFKVIKQQGNFALIECTPITGRTHQLRVHLSALSMPILGDTLYMPRSIQKELKLTGINTPRQMLHALRLAFIHPATGKRVSFVAPPPQDFLSLVEKLFCKETLRELLP